MTSPTPTEALKVYRIQSPDCVREQAARFIEMPVKDQLELLFYMSVHLSNALAEVSKEVSYDIQGMSVETQN